MKVNEIVVEALPGGGTLAGIAKELSKRIGGDANHYATWGDHNNPKFFGKRYDPLANKKSAAPQPTAPQPTAPQKSKLLKDFEVVHDNPVTIRWKNQDFQRNKMNGEWQNLGGKQPSAQLSGLLDQISPPQKNQGMANPFAKSANVGNNPRTTPTPTPNPTPNPTPQDTTTPQPAAPAKIRIIRNTDGSINVVDKLGKTWKSDAAGRFWQDTSTGAIYRPGSEQFEKLSSLNKNLKENRALPK